MARNKGSVYRIPVSIAKSSRAGRAGPHPGLPRRKAPDPLRRAEPHGVEAGPGAVRNSGHPRRFAPCAATRPLRENTSTAPTLGSVHGVPTSHTGFVGPRVTTPWRPVSARASASSGAMPWSVPGFTHRRGIGGTLRS